MPHLPIGTKCCGTGRVGGSLAPGFRLAIVASEVQGMRSMETIYCD